MKRHFLFTFLALGTLLSCSSAQKAQPAPSAPADLAAVATPPAAAFVTWDKKMVDFGKVKKGEKRETFFEFTNTSGADAQIDIVDACECTKVDFPRGIIKPGHKGRLDVVFDSTEKDAPETIGINIVFKQNDAAGYPRIEMVEYKFEIEK
ncbi:MAG: DUF1573 domain-containing protein [Saprospiraceae bacterium]|nr:DUF1573 domain-containing protein [Saprospiraceae bacterium]